jgi:fructose/tagatose bisphosphate aldolase
MLIYTTSLKVNFMKQFKMGFGPMSKEIIDILGSYSLKTKTPIMIIASRNQVDFNSGYVCTTQELLEQIAQYKTQNLLVCRDHCGPYFSDADRGMNLELAMARSKATILTDIKNKMDLIHIDVSRIPEKQLERGRELIEFALSQYDKIMLEFGSEDNTGEDIASSIARLDEQLEFLQQYKNNVKFFVTQTGSLTKGGQVGKFDLETNKLIAKKIHDAGFLFKEHNADYFTDEDIKLRIDAGIDSLNIAPQLGKVQTDLLKKYAPEDKWQTFADYVYQQGNWRRWVSDNGRDKDNAVSVSGHYCFNSNEYKDIIANIDYEKFKKALAYSINSLLDFYKRIEPNEYIFQQKLKAKLEELRKRDPFIYK